MTITATGTDNAGTAAITTSTPRTLTLEGLRFEKPVGVLGTAAAKMTLAMTDCEIAQTWLAVSDTDATIDRSDFLGSSLFNAAALGTITVRDSLFDGTNASDRAMDVAGPPGTGVTLQGTEVRTYSLTGAGIVKTMSGTTLNLTGTTKIRKNSTTSNLGGGGILVDGGALNIGPDVRITENGAPSGTGSGIANLTTATTINGATSSTVFGNVVVGTSTLSDPQCRALNGGSCLSA